VVYSPAHRPCASEETHGIHSSFRGFGFNLLERSPRPVSGGAPGQSDVTHSSVHRRISRRLARNVHVTGSGGIVAGSHVSPHKRAGVNLRMESNPALRPVAVQSTCVDSNRQQSSGGLHKSPRRCTISAAAEHSQTAAIRAVYIPGELNRGACLEEVLTKRTGASTPNWSPRYGAGSGERRWICSLHAGTRNVPSVSLRTQDLRGWTRSHTDLGPGCYYTLSHQSL